MGARHDGSDDCDTCIALGHLGKQDLPVLLPGNARLGALHDCGLFSLRSAGARQLLAHFELFGFVPADGFGIGAGDFRRDPFSVFGFSGHGAREFLAGRDPFRVYF